MTDSLAIHKNNFFFLQPVSLHYVFVLNTEYSDKQLMIKITEFL